VRGDDRERRSQLSSFAQKAGIGFNLKTWHGRPARESTRKMRVPQELLKAIGLTMKADGG